MHGQERHSERVRERQITRLCVTLDQGVWVEVDREDCTGVHWGLDLALVEQLVGACAEDVLGRGQEASGGLQCVHPLLELCT